jgi:hypothetical protein
MGNPVWIPAFAGMSGLPSCAFLFADSDESKRPDISPGLQRTFTPLTCSMRLIPSSARVADGPDREETRYSGSHGRAMP